MYQKCPKCGHERAGATASADSCGACGLIFSKYLKARLAPAMPPPEERIEALEGVPGLAARAKERVLHIPDEVPAIHVAARAALLAVLIIYGLRLAAMDIPSWELSRSLLHAPMVPIHEFGHVLFMPFGEFLHLLGGSLFQAALPLIFGGVFLVRNRDPFAAAVMLWWSSVAVMDIAPYIYDAKTPQHVLLTGRTGDTGAHDFIDVLGILGLLNHAQPIGYAAHRVGVLMLLVSFVWGAWVVWQQKGRIKES